MLSKASMTIAILSRTNSSRTTSSIFTSNAAILGKNPLLFVAKRASGLIEFSNAKLFQMASLNYFKSKT